MSLIAQQLLEYTRQRPRRELAHLLPLIHDAISSICRADGFFLLSIRSADDSFNEIDADDLPAALLWSPQAGHEEAYRIDDDARWRMAGDTIKASLALTGISPSIVNEAGGDAESPTLFERMANAICDPEHVTPGLTLLWADSLIMEPNHIILLLALEDDAYVVGVGLNLAGQTIVTLVGQQPFEVIHHQRDTNESSELGAFEQALPESGAFLTGENQPDESWWSVLCNQQEHTLLRATWLQHSMGIPLSLATPGQTPEWDGVPLLPLSSPSGKEAH